MTKRGVLQLVLQLNFWIVEDICNSLYLYNECQWTSCMSCRVATHHIYGATHCNLVKIIHFQLLCKFIITTPIMSLIVIHLLNLTHDIRKQFGHEFVFQNIDLYCPLWLLMMIQNCDMWHNWKLPHDILIIFWKCF
jgi:hypothetical protein